MEATILLDWLRSNLRLLGALAILVCIVTWVIDLGGWVHTCPYCRVQRSAIGLAGILMLLPDPRIWWIRYGAVAVCFLGAHVAAAQIFLVFRNLTSGQPSNPDHWPCFFPQLSSPCLRCFSPANCRWTS